MKKCGVVLLCAIPALLSGCSINRIATKMVANALTGVGASTVFTGDSDPRLVGDAIPFAIKIYEALLDQQPDHQGLILTTGSLLVMYANAFIQGPAQMLPSSKYEERDIALVRAKNLYLRGTDILRSGLEKKFPGFTAAAAEDGLGPVLKKAKKEDVPLFYWTVAGALSAYALDPFNIKQGMLVQEGLVYLDCEGDGVADQARVRIPGKNSTGPGPGQGVGYRLCGHAADGTPA
jgi:hypothetical protein